METYSGIGIMSGTSHDGLDIAYCTFTREHGRWKYKIDSAATIPYPAEWRALLVNLIDADEKIIRSADLALGKYIGEATADFISGHNINPDFIGSHGHTIFHEPDKGISLQIGDGKTIAERTGITVVNDFRSQDVAMGGQGAPLVPLGDHFLFQQYDYCLNLGGISNISFENNGDRIAFDICPVNMVLNHLASLKGKTFDDRGMMASQGEIMMSLLEKLEGLAFYSQPGPRSLGREWVLTEVFPLLDTFGDDTVNDLLATFTEHIAMRIAAAVIPDRSKNILITGGGAYNDFLVQKISEYAKPSLLIPDKIIIDYKEAMIFAFLGLLRLIGEVNVLGSVTGSGIDHSSGTVHQPN